MDFDNDKKVCLSKIDKSRKGSIDEHILDLVNLINDACDYYTTSSCSGRILLQIESDKKNENEWVFVSHDIVQFDELLKALNDTLLRFKSSKNLDGFREGNEIWFKMEALILHIACRDIKSAQALVDFSRNAGFRRTGIQSTNKKFIVEIVGTQRVECIVSRDDNILISDEYLKELISVSNERLSKNFDRIKRLVEFFK